MHKENFAIFGYGGLAREVASLLDSENLGSYVFFVRDADYKPEMPFAAKESEYDPALHGNPIVAIGDSGIRKYVTENILKRYPKISFPSIISCKAHVGNNIQIGQGVVITQGCVLTCDINIGDHVFLNPNTTIGHDAVLGRYTTTAMGVHVSGHVKTGECIFFGVNSCTVEEISICSNVIVGAGAVVAKDIVDAGVYVGVPARMIKPKK